MTPKGDIPTTNDADSTKEATLARWKTAGVIATVIVIFSLPLYLIRERNLSDSSARTAGKPAAAFVGSAQCRSCHKPEYDKWRGSHHERAMAEATPDSSPPRDRTVN
ncbi:MAG: multiheme c-type cytochrome [Desulfobacterales bacterium]